MLKDEQIRRAIAREANEGMIVILDRAGDLFAIDQFDSHRGAVFDEALQIADFLECLLRRARSLALLSRNDFSYLFFLTTWESTERPPS